MNFILHESENEMDEIIVDISLYTISSLAYDIN